MVGCLYMDRMKKYFIIRHDNRKFKYPVYNILNIQIIIIMNKWGLLNGNFDGCVVYWKDVTCTYEYEYPDKYLSQCRRSAISKVWRHMLWYIESLCLSDLWAILALSEKLTGSIFCSVWIQQILSKCRSVPTILQGDTVLILTK